MKDTKTMKREFDHYIERYQKEIDDTRACREIFNKLPPKVRNLSADYHYINISSAH